MAAYTLLWKFAISTDIQSARLPFVYESNYGRSHLLEPLHFSSSLGDLSSDLLPLTRPIINLAGSRLNGTQEKETNYGSPFQQTNNQPLSLPLRASALPIKKLGSCFCYRWNLSLCEWPREDWNDNNAKWFQKLGLSDRQLTHWCDIPRVIVFYGKSSTHQCKGELDGICCCCWIFEPLVELQLGLDAFEAPSVQNSTVLSHLTYHMTVAAIAAIIVVAAAEQPAFTPRFPPTSWVLACWGSSQFHKVCVIVERRSISPVYCIRIAYFLAIFRGPGFGSWTHHQFVLY